MRLETDEDEVIARLLHWASAQEPLRIMLLTSSRVDPGARTDLLSDYDIDLFVADPERFAEQEDWVHGFGTPLLWVRDTTETLGLPIRNDMVLYDDGTKIDYSLWPLAITERIQARGALPDEWDHGVRVLLDKDDLTRDWPPPTRRAFIPTQPTVAAFQSLVEEYWFVATYVAKNLWRGEFLPARVIYEHELNYLILRRFLEWRIGIDHGWTVPAGFFGKGLHRHLDPETWDAFQTTYSGPDPLEMWAALFRSVDLFRHLATGIAHDLGYDYPHHVDRQMSEYLRRVMGRTTGAGE
jgi:aminoglycoside 6-adenylyltransferase